MFLKRCMGRNKVILVDADVISHFMATGYIDKLTEIDAGGRRAGLYVDGAFWTGGYRK